MQLRLPFDGSYETEDDAEDSGSYADQPQD